MNISEVKKRLYKENPVASLTTIKKGIIHYMAALPDTTDHGADVIYFDVPVSDIGDAEFKAQMDSKHLNRWIVDYNPEK